MFSGLQNQSGVRGVIFYGGLHGHNLNGFLIQNLVSREQRHARPLVVLPQLRVFLEQTDQFVVRGFLDDFHFVFGV